MLVYQEVKDLYVFNIGLFLFSSADEVEFVRSRKADPEMISSRLNRSRSHITLTVVHCCFIPRSPMIITHDLSIHPEPDPHRAGVTVKSRQGQLTERDNFVKEKRKEWNLEVLIPCFKDEQIDRETLLLLDEKTLIAVTPKIGLRLKFKKHLGELLVQHVETEEEKPKPSTHMPKTLTPDCRPLTCHNQTFEEEDNAAEDTTDDDMEWDELEQNTITDRVAVQDTFRRIPLRPLVKLIHESPGTTEKIMKWTRKLSDSNSLDDITVLKSSVHPTDPSVPLLLYNDDCEMVNPLGSKTSIHKLGFIYFTLKCLPPECLSSLNSHFLLAVYKSDDAKTYGIDSVLKSVVDDINDLEKNGLEVDTSKAH
ncbi:hypothetical protein E1301_Tti020639 [Triplophysa tibetana]|uniref:Uncharacterized protein n=1 Tax=Triplophysa tibetana TaxID=1572043 RepID=A0A5A9PHB7_9TELE|nr:hypothetical protein E1301_Tti020639 [Triplophysa tibetana]